MYMFTKKFRTFYPHPPTFKVLKTVVYPFPRSNMSNIIDPGLP